jgi:hypothetical protein
VANFGKDTFDLISPFLITIISLPKDDALLQSCESSSSSLSLWYLEPYSWTVKMLKHKLVTCERTS